MLFAAFIILGAALLSGGVLPVWHLRKVGRSRPPRVVAVLHGLLAIGGITCLLIALRGPPRGLDTGTASFGTIAATLIVLAALAGGGMFAARLRKRRPAEALIGIHAALAVGGVVVLAVYVFPG